MADTSTDIRWPADGGRALCWVERGGRFMGIENGDGLLDFDALDLEQLEVKGPADRNACLKSCAERFPSDFKVCPDCGATLAPMFPAENLLWSYPGPEGDGLLNTEAIEIRRLFDPVTTLPKPPGKNPIFAVAGKPRRLFAVDREHSIVQVYNRQRGAWREFASDFDFAVTLPRSSWSIVALDNGFAFAGEDRPLVAALDVTGTKLDIVHPPGVPHAPLAGPILLTEKVLFLCVGDGDALSLVSWNPKSRAWTEESDVAATGAHRGIAFAAPCGKQRMAFWASREGYVAARAGSQSLEAVWRDWSSGFEPELQIRPIWTKSSFWQFGVCGGEPRFEELSRIGDQRFHDEIDGPHLTAGECSFASGMTIYATPWEPESSQTIGNNDSFLMPILGLRGMDALVADCGFDPNNRRFNPSSLLAPNAVAKPAQIRVYRSGGPWLDLRPAIRISSLLQLQAVVFDGRLLIYDSDGETIYAWKFE
jgi:hypothetical protein